MIQSADTTALQEYLRVIRRRKWTIVAPMILISLAAVLWSLRQTPIYEASAKVLLSRQNLANSLSGVPDPNASVEDQTLVQTQAEVARSTAIAHRTLVELKRPGAPTQTFLAQSSVAPAADADILTFYVRNENPQFATRAAAAYARQYSRYRHHLDTSSLEKARKEVAARIQQLAAAGQTTGALYSSLADREQQLEALEAVQTSNSHVIATASSASQVSPHPVRNGVLGLAVGAFLGLGLAFLREALDTRVRSAHEVGERLELPLLARIPEPSKKLRDQDELVMAADPIGLHAEA